MTSLAQRRVPPAMTANGCFLHLYPLEAPRGRGRRTTHPTAASSKATSIAALLDVDVTPAVALAVLKSIVEAARTTEPLARFALVVTPETAFLARRLELVIDYRKGTLYGLARALERAPHGPDLLVLAIGENVPKIGVIPAQVIASFRTGLAARGEAAP